VGVGTWNTFGGDCARALAEALAGRRDEAVVAEKIWSGSPAEGEQQLDASSIASARRDRADPQPRRLGGAAAALEEAREAGQIDRIGFTYDAPSAFGELAGALKTGQFETVKLPSNPLERGERPVERLATA
jgi:diketogulonate reductase-like aldo/keto reductase